MNKREENGARSFAELARDDLMMLGGCGEER